MKEPWYEEWFDSPYYHILYEHRNDEEAERFIHLLTEKLHVVHGSNILDAACGKGRHSKTLARLGFHVTGIDLSESNIAAAKKIEEKNLHFEEWDIREVYRENSFDYVFNLFSSFGYFEDTADDQQVVTSFAKSLKPGGTLVLDYINSQYAVKHIKAREIIPRGEIQFHIKKRIEKGFIKKKIEFLVAGTDHQFEESLKLINLRLFEEMFQHAGFAITHLFGDYELNEFNSSSSPRLILVAKKM
ncbi:MAG: methyltransferase domain-containing protein [Bacteroidetes bacterium]|nr:methyltransferase domain-containing protein [Bacteroidota bacterium]